VTLDKVSIKEGESLIQITDKVYRYECMDVNLFMKREMGVSPEHFEKVTHNKTLDAMIKRGMIAVTGKKRELIPGKAVKGTSEFVYNKHTYTFAYDENFILNIYKTL
jgi:hypothetical protein